MPGQTLVFLHTWESRITQAKEGQSIYWPNFLKKWKVLWSTYGGRRPNPPILKGLIRIFYAETCRRDGNLSFEVPCWRQISRYGILSFTSIVLRYLRKLIPHVVDDQAHIGDVNGGGLSLISRAVSRGATYLLTMVSVHSVGWWVGCLWTLTKKFPIFKISPDFKTSKTKIEQDIGQD